MAARNFLLLRFLPIGSAFLACGASAQPIDVELDTPSLDRWFYPFNASPGSKASATIFGAVTDPDAGFDPSFDNRDGQMLIGFDTSGAVAAGLGAYVYRITAADVYVTVSSDATFEYDPTADPYTSWLASDDPEFAPDPDAGRPVELFGAAFRCGFDALTFPENGPFCDGCSCFPPGVCKSVRCAFAAVLDAACGAVDASNNVDARFDPQPFAVAAAAGLSQGQAVDEGTELRFSLDLESPCVRGYLQQALDDGMLDVVIASIFPAAQQQTGDFPAIYCKEDPLVGAGVRSAARLEMTVSTRLGDTNGDGVVGVDDFLDVLAGWGACDAPCPPYCPADTNGDCAVDVDDFLTVLAEWG